MANFTPGPWRIESSGGDMFLRAANGESLMCDMQYYPWTPTRPEDWNLIAAAPDMYRALRSAVNCLCATRDQLLAAGGAEMPTLNECIAEWEATLAKAEGKEADNA